MGLEVAMETQDKDQVRAQVRTAYAKVAKGADGCSVGCCGTKGSGSLVMGYTETDLASVPEGADLGLGCGNPQAIAAMRPGETVLDLGSGAGFDCFLAASRVGRTGRVIGVDMTPEMVTKARDNARRVSATNVEFRLGEIEHLPVPDESVDVIISNCVINSVAGQGRGLSRGDPGPEARRAYRDLRRRRHAADPQGGCRERRGAHRVRRRCRSGRRDASAAGGRRLRSDQGRSATRQRRDHRAVHAGR